MEDALAMLARLRLGREEYCQRLLTMLILDGDYPRWNSRSHPSEPGARFLTELDTLSFGTAGAVPAVFVDEFDMPRRNEGERGCAPDYAVLWEDRLWLIELKTEGASHRRAQIPSYLELARHHYPDLRIDLTYLTPPMTVDAPALPPGTRFSHVAWEQAQELIAASWPTGDDSQRSAVEMLLAAVASIGSSWPEWRTEQLGEAQGADEPTVEVPRGDTSDDLTEALALAEATARDGVQRALDRAAKDLDSLQGLRLAVPQAICGSPGGSSLRHVMPWLWHGPTSGGGAITTAGADSDYELRFSRYDKPVC